MVTLHRTLNQPLEQVSFGLRKAAGLQGWAFLEAHSTTTLLLFQKGPSPVSLGAELRVQLHAQSASQTDVTIITGEIVAKTDWTRGQRAAERLLDDLHARTA